MKTALGRYALDKILNPQHMMVSEGVTQCDLISEALSITKSLVLHAVVNAHAVTCQSSWSYADDISGHVVLTSACGLLFVGKMGTVGCSPQAA